MRGTTSADEDAVAGDCGLRCLKLVEVFVLRVYAEPSGTLSADKTESSDGLAYQL